MKDSPFFKQAELMLRTLPLIAAEKCFALKGGTAINLFIRDMPRLSVDVDLTYLPIEPREKSLMESSLNFLSPFWRFHWPISMAASFARRWTVNIHGTSLTFIF